MNFDSPVLVSTGDSSRSWRRTEYDGIISDFKVWQQRRLGQNRHSVSKSLGYLSEAEVFESFEVYPPRAEVRAYHAFLERLLSPSCSGKCRGASLLLLGGCA